MTGPKLNEKSYVAGERSGTKATAKYVRTSAFKARAVLDLIRDLDVTTADQVLRFTERHVAHDVRKVLASAVANAVNNDGQDAEELFVLACFADEGPTLRRFRPRARGRASRINKRTCHITVIVARMSDERIEILQAREERAGGSGRGRPSSSAASRRARVERSRRRAAEGAGETDVDETVDDTAAEDTAAEDTAIEDTAIEDTAIEDTAIEDTAIEDTAIEEPESTDEAPVADDSSPVTPGSYQGSALPLDDGSAPEGYEIKGNEGSMLYHEPGTRYYKATKAEVWFDTVESAEAAGFTAPGSAKKDHAEETDEGPAGEGSASDEPDASRGGSEADDEGAIGKGSASDEPDASRGGSEADDEGAIGKGSASDEAQSDLENQRADEEDNR